jgi:ribokinase
VSGHVVAVGAINVDLVTRAPRLPGPGETVVGDRLQRFGGGKGANGAVAAARLGAVVQLVGAVGDDDDGRRTLAELRAEGVGVDGVAVLAEQSTGAALIVLDAAGENQIAVAAGANAAVTVAAVEEALVRLLPGAGCVLVSAELPDEAVLAAVAAAVAAGVPCVLNPAPARPALVGPEVRGALLTPNAGEARALAGTDDVEAAARALAARTGAAVVVTLGGDGALVAGPAGHGGAPVGAGQGAAGRDGAGEGAAARDGAGEGAAVGGGASEGGPDAAITLRRWPARPAEVVDTTGAGDAFNGALAAGLAAGDGLDDAVARALVAGALAVGRPGAREGMPTADELRRAG